MQGQDIRSCGSDTSKRGDFGRDLFFWFLGFVRFQDSSERIYVHLNI